MKKLLLLVVCFLLVVPVLANAACPPYEIGYKGDATMCIFQITSGIIGASVVLSTPENGVLVSKVTDAAGKYTVKAKINNCVEPVGFYTQNWQVDIDASAIIGNVAGAKKTCKASADFICCCPQCVQSIVKTCKLLYKFCC